MRKQLGIFVRTPVAGTVKTRLCPPLDPEQACDLYRAFLSDLSRRLEKLSSVDITVFYSGEHPERLDGLTPRRARLVPQRGRDLGERLTSAFGELLAGGPPGAVVIGSDSPDLPIQYVRRAFQRLRRKDLTLGPASDGGYYLVGLRRPCPALFQGIGWGGATVYGETLRAASAEGLTLATLPLWYDVDGAGDLQLLRDAVSARALERRDRLVAIERAFQRIDGKTPR